MSAREMYISDIVGVGGGMGTKWCSRIAWIPVETSAGAVGF